MIQLACLLWLLLVGYRIYDFSYIQNKPPPPASSPKEQQETPCNPAPAETRAAQPAFDPSWKGYGVKLVKAPSLNNTQMNKVKPSKNTPEPLK